MNTRITTGKTGHSLTVSVDGQQVADFHEISDDYAYTHRDEFVKALSESLPRYATVQEAVNHAYTELS